jgi:hypothetical protein
MHLINGISDPFSGDSYGIGAARMGRAASTDKVMLKDLR